MSWSGWLRVKHRPWREVCRGPTWGGCWDLLLAVRVWDDCEKIVCQAGRPPGKGAVTMKVDLVEFARAGERMRKLQNAYFKGGESGRATRLEEAIQAERHFDVLVKAVLHPEPAGLFDQQGEDH